MTTFEDLKKGMQARIVEVPSTGVEALRLQEMGLVSGTQFRVIKVAPLGDPVEIDLRGYRLCVRKQEMSGFGIEILS
jgi:ferrous iron transport protein A